MDPFSRKEKHDFRKKYKLTEDMIADTSPGEGVFMDIQTKGEGRCICMEEWGGKQKRISGLSIPPERQKEQILFQNARMKISCLTEGIKENGAETTKLFMTVKKTGFMD